MARFYALSPKNLTTTQWIWVFAIWTLACFSMATQQYFNLLPKDPNTNWFVLFAKRIPFWYVCALLTPFAAGLYEKYPLDTTQWQKNLGRQVLGAICILPLFSILRMFLGYTVLRPDLPNGELLTYLSVFISQLAWDTGVYTFIVVVLFADRTYQSKKNQELSLTRMELRNAELQQQLLQAQLEALKLQLSPHFLFNTLHAVGSLIRVGEYEKAIQVNARLGDFLRKTLCFTDKQFVTLAEELDFVDLYLNIESVRFKDRLSVEKEIDPGSLKVQVPYLILQPLIENAIKHGIAKTRQARLIRINASHENDWLRVVIYNDGVSLPPEWTLESHSGVGLSNVQSRLLKLYKSDCSFFLINNTKLGGVEALLQIPLQSPSPSYAS